MPLSLCLCLFIKWWGAVSNSFNSRYARAKFEMCADDMPIFRLVCARKMVLFMSVGFGGFVVVAVDLV